LSIQNAARRSRELLQEQMGDVALMPLFWVVDPVLTRGGIEGAKGRGTWNFFEWDKRQ
jgi:hypothetical protein